jgi:propane monooxygenase reductase component
MLSAQREDEVSGSGSMHRAALSPSNQTFDIHAEETVLDAALRQGIALEYGCRHGNCSSCKYYLASGDVEHGGASIYSLTEAERDEGFALLCCAKPISDLVIETRGGADSRALALIKPSECEATLLSVTQLTTTLWQLRIELAQALPFYAGQFVELKLGGQDYWRSYSIASAPADNTGLEFIIKRVGGGQFSDQIVARAPGAPLTVRGPFGTSYLRHSDAPVLLVAIGAGISPILSILRQAAITKDPHQFSFFYGARTQADIPLEPELVELKHRLGERFDFQPVLSQPEATWRGLRGRVTQALQRDVSDARPYDAYLCGAPDMCDAVGMLLEAKGIRAEQLFFDKFHAAT